MVKEKIWNISCYAGFSLFLLLAILTVPPVSAVKLLPHTEAYFHFAIDENFPSNSSQTNRTIAEGFIKLSGVGGLCSDNPLTLELRMILFRNSQNSGITGTIINTTTSVEFRPQYGVIPCPSIDVNNPPAPFVLTLNASNNWHASGSVEFFVSGTQGINVTFISSFLNQLANMNSTVFGNPPYNVSFNRDNVLQIGDTSVYVSAVNDEYVLSLTFLVVSIMFLELRTRKTKQ
jgi:hypothetical protein